MQINSKETQIQYWNERFGKEGGRYVGYAGDSIDQYNKRYFEWLDYFQPFWRKYFPTDGRILDFGCGVGRFTQHLSSKTVGVDIVGTALDIARVSNQKSHFLKLDETLLLKDFANKSFDGICE